MHEISLGGTIRDYLSGEDVPSTTYEEVRQALARMLVEELGYPRERLRSKIGVRFPIDDREYCRVADLVAYDDEDRPLLVIIFCSGMPGTYDRETVAAARLIPGGPAPLAVSTDTRDAVLLSVPDGEHLDSGMHALPRWKDLPALAEGRRMEPLSGNRLLRERRILFAYSEFLTSCCEGTCCPIPGR
ncbi:hypothetical protein dsx2_2226 [Desulfovibrio sp. X2]|uniref:type I restriction enzyme HsdR N-terminal domain-containing protein n=1 Tax=Desulfovibrio sp. X2 TaxID=941449 RepID=UPI000358B975|nr:type I restriction enzyme HsdR N-terminal domain-containing protein [Desulfovibrio sp. X2]EPR43609.1 hypothetical protein dsx2_2226 [Desulfovibrio sp. X2]